MALADYPTSIAWLGAGSYYMGFVFLVNIFIQLVLLRHRLHSNYWHQMEAGNLRPDSDEAEVLLTSIRIAQNQDDPLHYAEMNILYVGLDDWSGKELLACCRGHLLPRLR